MKFKILSRFIVAGLLVGIQACASNPIAQLFEKPYFKTPPAQLAKADKDHFEKALSRQIYNRVPAAIKAWNQFIEKHPRSFEAHNNLGLVYFEDDQVDQSIKSFETALALEPSDAKIKRNLVKVLKFKATLLKEAGEHNGAVDSLLRAQEISSGYGKERIGYAIEQYEDKVFAQAKQTNTLEAYEGFLQRFPNSGKNADEARMKIEGLKPVSAGVVETAMGEPKIEEPQKEEVSSTTGSMDETEVQEIDSQTASSISSMAKTEIEEIEQDGSMVEGSIEESATVGKDASTQMLETAGKAEESFSDASQVPEQPREVARSVERKVEIATQPEPKPSTAPDLFPSPAPKVSDPEPEEFAQVSPPPKKMVEVTTIRDPLRVRKAPSFKSKILATMAKGSRVPLIKEKEGWFNVEFSRGQMGWISKKYSRLME